MSFLPRGQLADSATLVLPTLIALLLFAGAVFGYFLPAYEETMLAGRRDTLRQLTGLAVHALDQSHARELSGELSRAAAQQAAIKELRQLRYGAGNDGYFWINDNDYRLIMHPHRPDLEGRRMTDYTDPTGKKIFVEFVNVATAQQQGFVSYLWQRNGDATRIEAKLSHVRSYPPWHWVVGTGMYIGDVHGEIATVTRDIYLGSMLVLVLLAVVLSYFVRRGMSIAAARQRAESALRRHQENLESIVTQRTVELQSVNLALAHENSERRALEAHLRELSCSDELTGLLNRRGFISAAEVRLAEAERTGESLYLAYADLDNMKHINDRLGHQAGDRALEVFSRVLIEDFRGGDINARLGGDEFALLLTGGASYGSEAQLVERIQQCVAARNGEELGFKLEVSVGVARYTPGAHQTLDMLLACADEAMYAIKQAKKAVRACAVGVSEDGAGDGHLSDAKPTL